VVNLAVVFRQMRGSNHDLAEGEAGSVVMRLAVHDKVNL
jgi:hypothetical protein